MVKLPNLCVNLPTLLLVDIGRLASVYTTHDIHSVHNDTYVHCTHGVNDIFTFTVIVGHDLVLK